MNTDIKIGVSLYSLSTEFIHGTLDLEGCLKAVHDMGYKGIELVAAQMVPDYPFPSDGYIICVDCWKNTSWNRYAGPLISIWAQEVTVI